MQTSETTSALDELADRQKREQSRHYARQPKPVKDIIAKLVMRRGLGRVLASAQLEEIWHQIVGRDVAAHSRPGQIRGGILEVIVTHSVLKQEMRYTEQQTLAQLRQHAPQLAVRGLRYRIGRIGS